MIGIGISPNLTHRLGASVSGLLDLYSGAAVAYSTRKLRNAYSGPCVRVRRSSDNTEQDIGFSNVLDANGNLFIDETALLAFVGSGDGFVVTRYDQSGNGLNETQSTAANQSRIVASGSVIKVNGKPTLEFNGTSNTYVYTGENYASMSGVSMFAVAYLDVVSAGGRTIHLISNGLAANAARFASIANSGGSNRFTTASRRMDADAVIQPAKTGINVGLYQVTSYVDYTTTGVIGVNTNNGTAVTASRAAGVSDSSAALWSGTGSAGGASSFFSGSIAEDVIYKSDQAANRTAIAANQITAFGVV